MTKTLIAQEKPFEPVKSARPFPWACVTGLDFGRSNAWAKRHPSTVRQQIRAKLGRPVIAP